MANPTSHSSAIRTAQILGISGTAFLSGMITNFSLIATPALACTLPLPTSTTHPSAPTTSTPLSIARQWQHMYLGGKVWVPRIVAACSVCFAWLGYRHWPSTTAATLATTRLNSKLPAAGYLYAGAALLVPSIIPFTLVVMMPTNDALETIVAAEEEEGGKSSEAARTEQVGRLMRKWSVLNYFRAVVVGAGALLGGVATMQTA